MYKYKYQFLGEPSSRERLIAYFFIILFSLFFIFGIFEFIILPLGEFVALKDHTMVEDHMLALEIDSLKELSRHQVALLESLDETNKKLLEESTKVNERLAESNEQGEEEEKSCYLITVFTVVGSCFIIYLKVLKVMC